MKTKILVFTTFLSLFLASCGTSGDLYTCIGTDRKKHSLMETDKQSIYVLFSTLGCHECHLRLNEFLEEQGVYDNDSIELFGLIAVPKKERKDMLTQKLMIAKMHRYYPAMKNFLFCSEEQGKINLLGLQINNFQTPAVIMADSGAVTYFNSDRVTVYRNKQVVVNPNLAVLLGLERKEVGK